MQQDDLIWSVIYNHFCSFQASPTPKHKFCSNPYSLTGLCERKSCPLANSTYATVRVEKNRICLLTKSIERAHSPKNLWDMINLPTNYMKALEKLDEILKFYPKFQVHRAKQRLTKLYQMQIRQRRIKAEEIRIGARKLVPIKKKIERQERTRERKALAAARIEKNIEVELLKRLKSGKYGDLYDLKDFELESEDESVEEEKEKLVEYEFEEGESEEEEEYEIDMEDMQLVKQRDRKNSLGSEKSDGRKSTFSANSFLSSKSEKAKVTIEYEYEQEEDQPKEKQLELAS
eukprot:snap_masked-scaffold_9-processed-gene-8.42-mRNA-1 protein AED:0.05 eAED:0.05 QI:0/-1/0/1/-1/1/1/0/288